MVSSCATLDPQSTRLLDMSRQTESDHASIKQLIAAGADVNARDRDGMTALYLASCNDNLEMVQQLVDHGAVVNVQTKEGKTPLYCAAQSGHLRIVEYLLAHGANCEARDKALVTATVNKRYDVTKTLIAAGADVDKMVGSGWTPLLFACLLNELPLAQLLVENGACVDLGSREEGFTPLYVAAESNFLDAVKFLVEHDADVNKRIGNGRTPLYAASGPGHLEVATFLISKGAEVDVVD